MLHPTERPCKIITFIFLHPHLIHRSPFLFWCLFFCRFFFYLSTCSCSLMIFFLIWRAPLTSAATLLRRSLLCSLAYCSSVYVRCSNISLIIISKQFLWSSVWSEFGWSIFHGFSSTDILQGRNKMSIFQLVWNLTKVLRIKKLVNRIFEIFHFNYIRTWTNHISRIKRKQNRLTVVYDTIRSAQNPQPVRMQSRKII